MTHVSTYRTKPLPQGELRGRFFLPAPLLDATRDILCSYAELGAKQQGHEGLVFLAGREFQDMTLYLSVIAPRTDHHPQRVIVAADALAAASRQSRHLGLGILCQIHSHPGAGNYHSDGDDDLIVLPFEGMLSIVVPDYGRGFTSLAQVGVHQFQQGHWVLCSPDSVEKRITVVPALVDLRE